MERFNLYAPALFFGNHDKNTSSNIKGHQHKNIKRPLHLVKCGPNAAVPVLSQFARSPFARGGVFADPPTTTSSIPLSNSEIPAVGHVGYRSGKLTYKKGPPKKPL